MDLNRSEFQQLLRTSAQDVLDREADRTRVREAEERGAPDDALWTRMVELGWTGLTIDEAYGGQGGTLLDLGTVVDELCRHGVLAPYVPTMLSAWIVQRFGGEELRRALLPRVAREGASVSVALLEGPGDTQAPLTTRFEGGVVRGEKRFVEYARTSDYHLVAATSGGAPGLALVPRRQAAARITHDLVSIGRTPQAIVSYEGATADGWIGGEAAVESLRLLGSALAAFEAAAYAQKALDMTVDYAQMRVQFGRPIGAFQAVQLRTADMAMRVQACRFLANELLWHFDQGTADAARVAVVKAAAARTCSYVTQESHLLHGGIGYMKEYDLYFNTIRGKEASLRFGSAREALNEVAEALLA